MSLFRTFDVADRWFFVGALVAAAGAWWLTGHPGAVLLVLGLLAALAGALGGTR